MLASTEATVRGQAERMKQYRGQMEEAGLMPKSPVRSRSESSLTTAASLGPIKGCVVTSNLPGIGLEKLRSYGKSENSVELRGEIRELQNSLMQYDNAVVSLRSQVRSLSASSEAGGDLTKRPVGSHIPVLSSRLRTISGSSASGSTTGSTTATTGSTTVTTGSTMATASSAEAQQMISLQQEVEDLTNHLVDSEETNAALKKQLEEAQKKAALEFEGTNGTDGTYGSDAQRSGTTKSMAQKLLKIEQVTIIT